MKNKLKSIFLLALSAGLLATSCSEDDHTGHSMINFTSPTVTIMASENPVIVDESLIDPDDEGDGYVIEVTASIPEPVFVDIHIPLVQTDGTADSSDFEAGTIIIVSGTTSASADVTIWRECESGVEGTETLAIEAGDNIANANLNPFTLDVLIDNDWVNDVLEISVGWEGTYTFEDEIGAEVTIDFCEIDVDTILVDDMGNALAYISGGSDCIEEGGISGLADGTYYIVADIYDNPFPGEYYDEDGEVVNEDVPFTTTYSQCGFPGTSGSFVTEGLTTETVTPPTSQHQLLGVAVALATVEVSGGYNYIVTPL